MTSDRRLADARKYEEENYVKAEAKPAFHIAAPVGWINDPNGLSVFNNQYHLFYQYHPYSTKWGPMHWGHHVSDDMVRWRHLPCALAPDEVFDKDGCFSGSALVHNDKHVLMYTGVADGVQAQCIAVGDGVDYEKLRVNPVIDTRTEHFRDPKIRFENGQFYAVIAKREPTRSAEIVEYASQDLTSWNFVRSIDASNGQLGDMWECPDFFRLDGRDIMLVSTQDTEAVGREIHPGNSNVYLLYDDDGNRVGVPRAIDNGLDFYAMQTTETPDGRRIMIGWAQNWQNYLTPRNFEYSGIMTVPRELSLCGDRLRQLPIRELDGYLVKSADQTRGRVFDLRVSAQTGDWFSVKLACGGGRYTSVGYDAVRNTLTVDRTHSGTTSDVLHSRTIDVANRQGKIDLRILVDKYIIEVFVNDGEQALTTLVYTPLDCDGIEFDGNDFSYTANKFDVATGGNDA